MSKKLTGGIIDTKEGARAVFLGVGLVTYAIGTSNGNKAFSMMGRENCMLPGATQDDAEGYDPDIIIVFSENADIQRMIDTLVDLRDRTILSEK